jgi:hypothetical protein
VGNAITVDLPKSVLAIEKLTGEARIRVALRASPQETMRQMEAENNDALATSAL